MIVCAKEVLKDYPALLLQYLKKVKPPQQVISAFIFNAQNHILFVTNGDGTLSLPVAVLEKGDNRAYVLKQSFKEAAGVSPEELVVSDKPVCIPELGQEFYASVGRAPVHHDLTHNGQNVWLVQQDLCSLSRFDFATQHYIPIIQHQHRG